MELRNISPLISTRIAYLPGCRDRLGGPVIVVPSIGEYAERPYDEVHNTFKYLAYLVGGDQGGPGLTLIVDMRNGWVKYLKLVLRAAQDVFGPRLWHALVVKPRQFLEKTRISINVILDGYKFKTIVVSDYKLSRYIDAETLPKELGGFMSYDHARWMELQEKSEAYLRDLEDFLRRVEGKPEAEWLPGEKEELQALMQEGRGLVTLLRPDDVVEKLRNQDHLAIANRIERFIIKFEPPKAREKTPSVVVTGPSSGKTALSAPSSAVQSRTPSPSILKKPTPEMPRKAASPALLGSSAGPALLEGLGGDPGVVEIQQRVEKKLTALTYDHFILTADTVCEWVQGPGESWLLTLHEIGESTGDAELLWSGHDDLIQKSQEILSQAFELCSIAGRLIEEAEETDPSKVPALKERRLALDTLSKNFHARAVRQKEMAEMSVRFHKIYDRLLAKVEKAVQQVRTATNDVTRSSETADAETNAILKAFDEAYPELEVNGEHFITHLEVHEHNSHGHLITRDYSPGIAHVRDCLRRIQASRGSADELLVLRGKRSQDLLHLASAEKEVLEAIKSLTLQWHKLNTLALKEDMTREELETVLKEILEIEAFARMSYNKGRNSLTNYALLRRSLGKPEAREEELNAELTDAWSRFAGEFEAKESAISRQDQRSRQLVSTAQEVATSLNQVCSRANSEPELAMNRREASNAELLAAEARLLRAVGSQSPSVGRRTPKSGADDGLRKEFHHSIKELHSVTQSLVETLERPRLPSPAPSTDVARERFRVAAAEWERAHILLGDFAEMWKLDADMEASTSMGDVMIPEDREEAALFAAHPGARRISRNFVIEHIELPPPRTVVVEKPVSTLDEEWVLATKAVRSPLLFL